MHDSKSRKKPSSQAKERKNFRGKNHSFLLSPCLQTAVEAKLPISRHNWNKTFKKTRVFPPPRVSGVDPRIVSPAT
jgi:hypothetical protein